MTQKSRTQARTFSLDEKLSILSEWKKGGLKATAVAKRHHIPPQYLYQWRKAMGGGTGAMASVTATPATSIRETNVDALHSEIAQLRTILGNFLIDTMLHGASPPVSLVDRLRGSMPQQAVSGMGGLAADGGAVPAPMSNPLTANIPAVNVHATGTA